MSDIEPPPDGPSPSQEGELAPEGAADQARREDILRRVWGSGPGTATRPRPLRRTPRSTRRPEDAPADVAEDDPPPAVAAPDPEPPIAFTPPGAPSRLTTDLSAAVDQVRSILRSTDPPGLASVVARLEALETRIASTSLGERANTNTLERMAGQVERLGREMDELAGRMASQTDRLAHSVGDLAERLAGLPRIVGDGSRAGALVVMPDGLLSAMAELTSTADALASQVASQPSLARVVHAVDDLRPPIEEIASEAAKLRDGIGEVQSSMHRMPEETAQSVRVHMDEQRQLIRRVVDAMIALREEVELARRSATEASDATEVAVAQAAEATEAIVVQATAATEDAIEEATKAAVGTLSDAAEAAVNRAAETSRAAAAEATRAAEAAAAEATRAAEAAAAGATLAAEAAAAGAAKAAEAAAEAVQAAMAHAIDATQSALARAADAGAGSGEEHSERLSAMADGLTSLRESIEEAPKAISEALGSMDKRSGTAFALVARQVRDLVDEFRAMTEQLDTLGERLAAVELAVRHPR